MSFISAHPLTAIALLLLAAFAVVVLRFVIKIHRKDPTVWAGEMRRFDKFDRRDGVPNDVILFTGSSSIRYWSTLVADMSPLPVLNRGFGGSQIDDVTYYADRVVLQYKPKAIVFYAGENDMAGVLWSSKRTPEEVRDAFRAFCQKIFARQPGTPIYFISIKPPRRRIAEWPSMQIANRLIRDHCASDSRLHYIDIVPPMLDAQGNPRGDLYGWDGIHMNAQGYAIWTTVIKPVLMGAQTLRHINEVTRSTEL
ncbi:MAG TPA: GDSL-type esterase/lipase family protein [Steroidobacteraceae bacterium]|nr:GDSL-type esterase/lipase family protein [Steroidobacteraceae bacterium]